jgi:hypothetical protein
MAAMRSKGNVNDLRTTTEYDMEEFTKKPFDIVRLVELSEEPWFARQKADSAVPGYNNEDEHEIQWL